MFELHSISTRNLSAVDLKIQAGEVVALHGPSGSGKTLLLRAIADLDQNNGEALLHNQPRSQMTASHWRQQVAYLPSESHWWSSHVADHSEHWQLDHINQLGFPDTVLDWEVSRLSSGEKQRLALLRMLSTQPKVLLLDEPTANLDPHHTELIEKLLLEYLASGKCCAIWVSHCPAQRCRVAKRQLGIHKGKLSEENSAWN